MGVGSIGSNPVWMTLGVIWTNYSFHGSQFPNMYNDSVDPKTQDSF